MWCQCTGRGKRGYARQEDSDLWIDATCGLPTRMVFEKMTDRRAPKNAKLILNCKGKANGTWLITFRLLDGSKKTVMYYHPYPNKVDMETPRDVLVDLWHSLDELIVSIKAGNPSGMGSSLEMEVLKGQASLMAQVIAKIMSPFYEDATAVLRESQMRWVAKQQGDWDDYESPGLAEEIWNPNTRFDGTPYSTANINRVRSGGTATKPAPRKTGNSIPPQAIVTARQAVESGMFTYAQLAKTYGMNEDEVREQLGLD